MGRRFKASSDRLMKPEIEPATPCLQGKWLIHYTTAAPTKNSDYILLKDYFLKKVSYYYQYVYLEIIVSCYQHGSNYFLLVQNRHTPKGSDLR